MGKMDGKAAVVTGGAAGLGAAVTELYCREGAKALGKSIAAEYGVYNIRSNVVRPGGILTGMAAARAVKSGFDTVELHLAHGYSPHEFLSPAFNHRADEYGCSFENRSRFPLECIRAIRRNIPSDMPLFMRIDSQDDYLEDGLTLEDIIAFCNLTKAEGVNVVHISRGNPITLGMKFEVGRYST